MRYAIGCDHAGFSHKDVVIRVLEKHGHDVADYGTFTDESTDYPDHIHPAMKALTDDQAERAIILCGSGNGVAMTANKYAHVRAALCWDVELASLARQHNDANVLALPARYIDHPLTEQIVETFITTQFEGGRHARRVSKISC